MVYRLLFFCGIVFLYCLTLLFPPPSTSFYFDMELLSRHQHIIRSSTAKPVRRFSSQLVFSFCRFVSVEALTYIYKIWH